MISDPHQGAQMMARNTRRTTGQNFRTATAARYQRRLRRGLKAVGDTTARADDAVISNTHRYQPRQRPSGADAKRAACCGAGIAQHARTNRTTCSLPHPRPCRHAPVEARHVNPPRHLLPSLAHHDVIAVGPPQRPPAPRAPSRRSRAWRACAADAE